MNAETNIKKRSKNMLNKSSENSTNFNIKNVLIVGLGSMGKRRARLIKGIQESINVCGVDTSEARRSEAESLGITAFESIDAATKAHEFCAAFVCTAPISHAAVIGELLNEGLNVFTELNLVDTGYTALISKAKEKNLKLFLSNTMLYRKEIQHINKSVKAFDMPVNYIYHIGQYLPDWHPWESYKNFFVGDKQTSGIREIFGIDLPWLVETFGEVSSVSAYSDKLTKLELEYDDSYYVTLLHKNGTKGFLAADVVSPKAVRNFEVFGEGLHIFWNGSPESLSEFDKQQKASVPVNTYAVYEHDEKYSDNIVENAYVDEIIDFFNMLEHGATPLWSFEKDAEVIDLIERIMDSAAYRK